MAEQVYLYDGTPVLVVVDWDYPNQPYTKIPPDDGMYYPIYFDEDKQKWIGSEPPLKNSDLKRLEEAINSQNEKFEYMIDRNNKIEQNNVKILKLIGNILLSVSFLKKHTGYTSNNIINKEDVQYLYNLGIYTNFSIRQLVDAEIITKEEYELFTGETLPEQPQNINVDAKSTSVKIDAE